MHELRRRDRAVSTEAAWEILDASGYGVLAMTSPEGRPYAVALNLARRGDCLYFHSAREGRKVDCLRQNGAVCVFFVAHSAVDQPELTTRYASAAAFGQASEVTDVAEKAEALRLLCRRFAPDAPPRDLEACGNQAAVWKIQVTDITGKRNAAPGAK